MNLYLLIAFFGAIGSLCRYFLFQITPKIYLFSFPLGTILANLLGSFAFGLLFGLYNDQLLSHNLRIAIIVGLLGGFTTFSGLSYELFRLIENSDYMNAFLYIFITLFFGLFLFYFGSKLPKLF